jgi:hypothetical protein
MPAYNRHGYRWTVNELLSLQREYELLEWTVQQIAEKHQRSVNSILFKLEQEGYINSWNNARGFNPSYFQENYTMNTKNTSQNCEADSECDSECLDDDEDEDYVEEEDYDDDDDDDDEDEGDDSSEVTKLAERVWSLEASVSDISFMVKQMFDSMVNTAPKKRQLVSSTR